MQFRILDVSEWKNYPEIEGAFHSRGRKLPNPHFAMIAAAFMESTPPKLQGFLVCQLQIHAEPLVLFNPFAVRGLMHTVEEDLISRLGPGTEYFACVEQTEQYTRMESMLESLGLGKMPMTLFHKVL